MSPLGDGFWGYMATRWASSESTQRETWQHGLETKAAIPLAQAGILLLSFLCIVGGAALVIWPLFAVLTTLETMMLATGTILVVGLVVSVGRYLEIPATAQGVVSVLVVAFLFASLRLLVTGLHGWRQAWFWFGFCLIIASAVLASHMMKELTNPWWRQSPFEKLLGPALASRLMRDDALPPDGGWVRLNASSEKELKAMLSLERPRAAHPASLPPEAADFVDFLVLAGKRGLARDNWLPAGQVRVRLPSTGKMITRGAYNQLMREAEEWGFVENRGTAGWQWVMPRGQVLSKLAEGVLHDNNEGNGL